MTYLSHLLIRQTLRINKKTTRFTTLKPKRQWDLMLKMVFRQNLLYFASRIMFMDGLYLDNDFRTLFLSCFIISVAVLSGFVILSFGHYYYYYYYHYYYYYIFIKFVLILCGYVMWYFVKLLGILIVYVRDVLYHFMLFLLTAILALRS